MSMDWKGGDAVRRMMAARELQAAGLSSKAAAALFEAGIFTARELVTEPWTDEEAGRAFASVKWRLSVAAGCNPKVLAHIEAARGRLLQAGHRRSHPD